MTRFAIHQAWRLISREANAIKANFSSTQAPLSPTFQVPLTQETNASIHIPTLSETEEEKKIIKDGKTEQEGRGGQQQLMLLITINQQSRRATTSVCSRGQYIQSFSPPSIHPPGEK
jgi:DNA segregation ATPase FtsK/SpoIIIE-like protein